MFLVVNNNNVEIKTKNLDETIKLFRSYPSILKRTREPALASTGNKVQKDVRKFIERGGDSSWPKKHPVSNLKREGGIWKRKFIKKTAFHFLGKFARFKLQRRATQVRIQFGKTKSGKGGEFDKNLIKLSKEMQRGRNILVTDKMRRLFGATKRKADDIPGQEFFPLRKDTTSLKMEGRPVFDPVFDAEKNETEIFFERKYLATFDRVEADVDKRIN